MLLSVCNSLIKSIKRSDKTIEAGFVIHIVDDITVPKKAVVLLWTPSTFRNFFKRL